MEIVLGLIVIVLVALLLCWTATGKEKYVSGGLDAKFLPDANCSWSGNRASDWPYEMIWSRFLNRDGQLTTTNRWPYRPRPIIDTDWIGFDAFRWRTIGVGYENGAGGALDPPVEVGPSNQNYRNEWEIQAKYNPKTKLYEYRCYNPSLNRYFGIVEKTRNLVEDGMILNPIINLNTFVPLVYRKLRRNANGSIHILAGENFKEGMKPVGKANTEWNSGCNTDSNVSPLGKMGNVFNCQSQGDYVPLEGGSELNQAFMVKGRGDQWSVATMWSGTPKGGVDKSTYFIGNWNSVGWATPIRGDKRKMWRIYRRYDPKIKTWRNILVRRNKNKFTEQIGTLATGEQVMSIPDGKWYMVFMDYGPLVASGSAPPQAVQ